MFFHQNHYTLGNWIQLTHRHPTAVKMIAKQPAASHNRRPFRYWYCHSQCASYTELDSTSEEVSCFIHNTLNYFCYNEQANTYKLTLMQNVSKFVCCSAIGALWLMEVKWYPLKSASKCLSSGLPQGSEKKSRQLGSTYRFFYSNSLFFR